MEGNGREKILRTARSVLSLIIIALYIAGLVAMFAGRAQLGITLWVISTLAGIGLLYWIRTMKRRAEDAEKIAKGLPYGEPDDPCAPVNPAVPPSDGEDAP